jgi:hypothetical protein
LIKYRSRQILNLEAFLATRPDIQEHYIYDLLLSSGDLLTRCKGGVGQTPERYISRMFDFFSRKNALSILHEEHSAGFGKGSYTRLRAEFNAKQNKLGTLRDCAKLYLLWANSNFSHSYNAGGFNGKFCPVEPDWAKLEELNAKLRDNFYSFRQAGFNSVHTDLLTPEVVIFAKIPDSYGKYGSGFKWVPSAENYFLRVLESFHEDGHKICVSCRSVNNCNKGFLSALDCVMIEKGLRFTENFYLNF